MGLFMGTETDVKKTLMLRMTCFVCSFICVDKQENEHEEYYVPISVQ